MNKLNGFLVLNKPNGITSREACVKVKEILNVKKAGHSGTLDPNATGVLLICLNDATKIMPALQNLDKEYLALMHVHKDISTEKLKEVINDFVGEIYQVPPVRSAVARKLRKRMVYSIEILSRNEKDVELKIRCQAGTYIRKLISDIGQKISGAHMKTLQRTKVGAFGIEQSHTIDELKNEKQIRKMILPVDTAVEHLKKIIIKDSAIKSVCNGAPIFQKDILNSDKNIKMTSPKSFYLFRDKDYNTSLNNIKRNELISILSSSNELIALGRFKGDKIVAKIERVIKNA